jgi:hypothetical protein
MELWRTGIPLHTVEKDGYMDWPYAQELPSKTCFKGKIQGRIEVKGRRRR